MRELLELLQESDERALLGGARGGRRGLNVDAVLNALIAVSRGLVDARAEEDAARLVACAVPGDGSGNVATVAVRLVALRRHCVWAQSVELAELACLLLSTAVGGERMSPDEAGVAVDEESRELVGWMVKAAERIRARGPK